MPKQRKELSQECSHSLKEAQPHRLLSLASSTAQSTTITLTLTKIIATIKNMGKLKIIGHF